MNMPTFDDASLFSFWDGVLVAVFLFVCGALIKTMVRIYRVRGVSDPSLKIATTAGWFLTATAIALGVAAWVWMPDRGPGVWGVLAILGCVMVYANAIAMARGKKMPF